MKHLLVLLLFFSLFNTVVGCRQTAQKSAEPTETRDYSTTRLSNIALYRVTYTSEHNPVPVRQLHTWQLHIENAQTGEPIDSAEIAIDGDMLEHGHGLPTQPEVTQNLGEGNYLVEGVKFQMGGWWVMDFTITANGETDTVRFNLQLTP